MRKKKSFTLLEILIVVLIVMVLGTLALAGY
ncbi:MAG: prepilin-type N-terminal cleavage/methylation domain-containing protein, partial [Candidatus Omnitrophica bacterium]|nr:prepilin-type N-terminal cleavage/methylation domain-containing protein [Candidatus Omnitrophota bacterium]